MAYSITLMNTNNKAVPTRISPSPPTLSLPPPPPSKYLKKRWLPRAAKEVKPHLEECCTVPSPIERTARAVLLPYGKQMGDRPRTPSIIQPVIALWKHSTGNGPQAKGSGVPGNWAKETGTRGQWGVEMRAEENKQHLHLKNHF